MNTETTMKLRRAEKPVGALQNFKKSPLARRVTGSLPHQAVSATASSLWRAEVGGFGSGCGCVGHLTAAFAVPRSAGSATVARSRTPCRRPPRDCCQALHPRPTV